MDGDCACGKKFYSYTNHPKDANKALQYMEKQYREHQDERYTKEDNL
jgi:hypothetical protein